jgi:hypothetical protein
MIVPGMIFPEMIVPGMIVPFVLEGATGTFSRPGMDTVSRV